jgi:hypothetical protein
MIDLRPIQIGEHEFSAATSSGSPCLAPTRICSSSSSATCATTAEPRPSLIPDPENGDVPLLWSSPVAVRGVSRPDSRGASFLERPHQAGALGHHPEHA